MIDFSAVSSTIRMIAVFFSVIIIGYAGLVLITNRDPIMRNEWKEIITGVLIGLSILFIAPVISGSLMGGGYCSP